MRTAFPILVLLAAMVDVKATDIILPLTTLPFNMSYIEPYSWEPLITAAQSYPSLQFLAYIRPPDVIGRLGVDETYSAQVISLKKNANVRVLCILTVGAERSSEAIEADIELFAGWQITLPLVYPFDGILLSDVVPGQAAAYRSYSEKIKSLPWNSGNGNGYVFMSAGYQTVDPNYFAFADQIVVLDTFHNYWAWTQRTFDHPSQTSVMVSEASPVITASIASDLAAAGIASIYVTEYAMENILGHGFGTTWSDFVAAVAKTHGAQPSAVGGQTSRQVLSLGSPIGETTVYTSSEQTTIHLSSKQTESTDRPTTPLFSSTTSASSPTSPAASESAPSPPANQTKSATFSCSTRLIPGSVLLALAAVIKLL